MENLNNTVAIITGGGSGMGAATARALAAKGATIALLDINPDAAKEVAKEINGSVFPCDVSDARSVETAMQGVVEQLGAARICVSCAGIAPAKRIVGKEGPMPLEDFSKVIQINLLGTFNVMRLAAANMQLLEPQGDSGERGVIINTASVAAFDGQIGQAAYSASKGGVVAMTLPAARELAKFGIRVMTIAPGIMDTPMMANMPQEVQDSLIATIPFPHRFGKASEYASLVLHIVQNTLLNGEVIRLDGAIRMQSK